MILMVLFLVEANPKHWWFWTGISSLNLSLYVKNMMSLDSLVCQVVIRKYDSTNTAMAW